MPFKTPDGDIVATIKGKDGEPTRNITIMKAVPSKGKGRKKPDGSGVGGRNALELTDDGAAWITSEIAKGSDINELADVIGVDIVTLYNGRNGAKTKSAVKEGNATCNMRLRKSQVNAALNGNSSLLIWLGKNRLGQSDSPKSEGNHALAAFAEDMAKAARRLDYDRDTDGWEE